LIRGGVGLNLDSSGAAIPRSSVVEQPAVNRRVVGSSPTAGVGEKDEGRPIGPAAPLSRPAAPVQRAGAFLNATIRVRTRRVADVTSPAPATTISANPFVSGILSSTPIDRPRRSRLSSSSRAVPYGRFRVPVSMDWTIPRGKRLPAWMREVGAEVEARVGVGSGLPQTLRPLPTSIPSSASSASSSLATRSPFSSTAAPMCVRTRRRQSSSARRRRSVSKSR
jgi:hypothetical protein